ncbi:flagellar hook-length control protein FliK [Adhaeretor mobilis]|uniref:Flagellar hook-length control protein FliK n=1 Tax=Adhaeretor mobilis TaxID=1930276 RepID=A0A517MZ04_9BACT|nr:flagellar hook-length control protein FliK [Adhaeretor mobilis]QDT00048.1 Flagellar hook-length control protein FliK [Adhaeretor mobilis]
MSTSSIDPLISLAPTTPSSVGNAPRPGGFGDLFEQALTTSAQPERATDEEETALADEAASASSEVTEDRDPGENTTEEFSASEPKSETESKEEAASAEDSSDEVEISEEAAANQKDAEEVAANQQSVDAETSAELLGEVADGESAVNQNQELASGEEGDQPAGTKVENEAELKNSLGETAQQSPNGDSDERSNAESSRDAVDKTIKGDARGHDQESGTQQEATDTGTDTSDPDQVIGELALDEEDLNSHGPHNRHDRGSRRASSTTQNAQVAEVGPAATKAENQAQLEAAKIDSTQLTASQSTQHNSTQGADPAAVLNSSTTTTPSVTEATGTESDVRDTPTVDKNRFLGRVSGALKAAQQRDGRIQVRLAPPELGLLRIELSVQQGSLTASLETETNAAKNLLLDNLPALRERLAEQDIRVEKFDVDVRRDGQQSPDHELPGERQSQNPRRTPARAGITVSNSSPGSEPSGETTTATTDAGLDIRV